VTRQKTFIEMQDSTFVNARSLTQLYLSVPVMAIANKSLVERRDVWRSNVDWLILKLNHGYVVG
jgi:hypothetical protein